MSRKRKISIGAVFVAFGLALALSLIVPARYLVILVSIALIVSGIALCKTC